MSRDLRILHEDQYFLGYDEKQKYPFYYPYVICYALLNYLEQKNGEDNESNVIENLKDAINGKRDFRVENFLEIFHFQNDGFVVVDLSKGCYPLIMDTKERQDAFFWSLNHIVKEYKVIADYLVERVKSCENWDRCNQSDLFKEAKFKYPIPEK